MTFSCSTWRGSGETLEQPKGAYTKAREGLLVRESSDRTKVYMAYMGSAEGQEKSALFYLILNNCNEGKHFHLQSFSLNSKVCGLI